MKNFINITRTNFYFFFTLSFCIISLNDLGASQLRYGEQFFIKNAYGGGSYLETCGHGSCTSGTKYNVTTNVNPDKVGEKTGTWIIVSATGKSSGSNVLIGDIVYLKNVYGGGTYLETCGSASCTSGTTFNVTTNAQSNRGGHNTGKWQILSASGSGIGNFVGPYEHVYLKNMYLNGSYLDTCGHGDCSSGTKYNVTTHSRPVRDGSKTGTWSFEPYIPRKASRPVNFVYTADGVEVMQFKYKKPGQTYTTECSVPDWLPMVDVTTTTDKYLKIFAPACHNHDLYYKAPWRMAGFTGYSGKDLTDNKFHADMLKICVDVHDNVVEESYCAIVAKAWFEAVKKHGFDAFDNGQKVAEKDCDAYSISLN